VIPGSATDCSKGQNRRVSNDNNKPANAGDREVSMRMSPWKKAVVMKAAAAMAVLAAMPFAASAQNEAANWPNKPVRIIVNFAPGGSADNSTRPFAERLSKALGQQFVLEHRGGASGSLGLETVMKAAPDGYTFGVTPALSVAILPHIRKTAYDPLKDFVPVTQFTNGTLLVAVHPSVKANTVQELVAEAKASPGKLVWGTAGIGSQGHILAESFKLAAGIDILHVPYRGGAESLADLLAGIHQIHADPNTMPHIAAGKAKLLAVLDKKRHPDYPNVPLLSEIYPQLDFLGWFGMLAPAGTPKAIVDKLAAEMNKIAREPELVPFFLKLALSPNVSSPEDLAALMKSDFERYGKIVTQLKLKVD
jgi:tripartite-type tricarboxylate transporter receptor subunit TctC